MDLSVPSWLGPDFETDARHAWTIGSHELTHLQSKKVGGLLTVRVKVARASVAQSSTGPSVDLIGVDDLSLLLIFRGLLVVLGSWIAVELVNAIVQGIREIRRIVEIGPVQLVGVGVAAVILIPRLRHLRG